MISSRAAHPFVYPTAILLLSDDILVIETLKKDIHNWVKVEHPKFNVQSIMYQTPKN